MSPTRGAQVTSRDSDRALRSIKKFAIDGYGVFLNRSMQMKSIQLINTGTGWKISAVAWDDERYWAYCPAFVEGIEQAIPGKVKK